MYLTFTCDDDICNKGKLCMLLRFTFYCLWLFLDLEDWIECNERPYEQNKKPKGLGKRDHAPILY